MQKKSLFLLGIATVAIAALHQISASVAVFYAAKGENIRIIKYYLEQGVNVNTVYGYSCTSLCWDYLSLGGEYDVITRGAGSGEWSYSGTLLDVAVAKNNLQMINLLLNYGANVNIPINYGETPLAKAVGRNNLPMVKFLLAHGADVKKDVEALHTAIYQGDLEMVELLISHGAADIDGGRLLYTAVGNGDELTSTNERIVKLLLAHGADTNAQNKEGNTPLYGALLTSQKNKKNIVKLLLVHGADINIKNRSGVTPLYSIVGDLSYTDKEVVELILAKGANVNVSDYWTGETLLQAAARSGKKETVKLLLAKGANAQAKNTDGKTPLETTSNQDIQALLKRYNDTK